MVDAPPPAFIDAHHHLWRYEPADFGWIGDEMPVLKRDFLPPELTSTIAAAGVVGTVAVQADSLLTKRTSCSPAQRKKHPFWASWDGFRWPIRNLKQASPNSANIPR